MLQNFWQNLFALWQNLFAVIINLKTLFYPFFILTIPIYGGMETPRPNILGFQVAGG
jgi:hypothetical protein